MNAHQRRTQRRITRFTAFLCGGPPPPEAASLPEACPTCGKPTEYGYGLMGGGLGPYVLCSGDECDFFAKQQEKEMT